MRDSTSTRIVFYGDQSRATITCNASLPVRCPCKSCIALGACLTVQFHYGAAETQVGRKPEAVLRTSETLRSRPQDSSDNAQDLCLSYVVFVLHCNVSSQDNSGAAHWQRPVLLVEECSCHGEILLDS